MTSVQSRLHVEPAGLASNRGSITPRRPQGGEAASRRPNREEQRGGPRERSREEAAPQRGQPQGLGASGWALGGQAALVAGGGIAGIGGHTVLGEHCLELLQCGIGPHARGVEVRPAHPEAGLRQVLEELVQPARMRKTNAWPSLCGAIIESLYNKLSSLSLWLNDFKQKPH